MNIEVNKNKVEILLESHEIEQNTLSQIYKYMESIPEDNQNVVIMPDCHAGAGSVIGFTSTFENRIIPNTVGVDLSCGVRAVSFPKEYMINIPLFDNMVKEVIPRGFNINNNIVKGYEDLKTDVKRIGKKFKKEVTYFLMSLGSLGGGNHFVELGDDGEKYWLFVHSGSRNFGYQICKYWQLEAKKKCKAKVPKPLRYLELSDGGCDYLIDHDIAREYARVNREIITDRIIKDILKIPTAKCNSFDTVHNYVDTKDKIIRKGSIRAKKGDRVVIPLNAEDGVIIAQGKSGKELNYSAPHGAGRIGSRRAMKESGLDITEIRKRMLDNGIYTSTLPIDEVKEAYKSSDLILSRISELVDIEKIVKPFYSLKG